MICESVPQVPFRFNTFCPFSWVPTSFNRTATLNQQGGGPGGGGGGPQQSAAHAAAAAAAAAKAMPGIKLETLQHKRPENGDDIFYSIFPVENEELSYGETDCFIVR